MTEEQTIKATLKAVLQKFMDEDRLYDFAVETVPNNQGQIDMLIKWDVNNKFHYYPVVSQRAVNVTS